jgi:hypothetical protein
LQTPTAEAVVFRGTHTHATKKPTTLFADDILRGDEDSYGTTATGEGGQAFAIEGLSLLAFDVFWQRIEAIDRGVVDFAGRLTGDHQTCFALAEFYHPQVQAYVFR